MLRRTLIQEETHVCHVLKGKVHRKSARRYYQVANSRRDTSVYFGHIAVFPEGYGHVKIFLITHRSLLTSTDSSRKEAYLRQWRITVRGVMMSRPSKLTWTFLTFAWNGKMFKYRMPHCGISTTSSDKTIETSKKTVKTILLPNFFYCF